MDVGSGGLAGDGVAESKERDVVLAQILAEPSSFGSIRLDGHIDPTAVVEAERPVNGRFSVGAHGQRSPEASFEGRLNFGEDLRVELTVAGEVLGESAASARLGSRFVSLLGNRHLSDFAGEAGARFGEIHLFAREVHFLKDRAEGDLRSYAGLDQLLRLIELFFLAIELTLGSGRQGGSLVLSEVRLENIAADQGTVLSRDNGFAGFLFLHSGKRTHAYK